MTRVLASVVVLIAGCSFEPREAQFTCRDGRCPVDLVCVAEVCVRDAPDAGEPDAGEPDAGEPDAGEPDSGAADAGEPECVADFCADFDDVATVQESWDVPEVVGTGRIERLETTDAPSAPAVFESAITVPPPDASYHAARLSHQPMRPGYDVSTPLLRFSFSLQVVAFEDNPGVTIASVRYGDSEANLVLALNPAGGGDVMLTCFMSLDSIVHDVGVVPVGEWLSISVIIPARAGAPMSPVGGGATIEVDGTPETVSLVPAPLTSLLRFDVGLAHTNPDGRVATVRYDDVAIEYDPL